MEEAKKRIPSNDLETLRGGAIGQKCDDFGGKKKGWGVGVGGGHLETEKGSAASGCSTQVWKYPILERLVGSPFGKSRFVFEKDIFLFSFEKKCAPSNSI